MNFAKYIPTRLRNAINELESHSVKVFIVGGYCRDIVMEAVPKDIDLVVESDKSDAELIHILHRYGEVVDSKSLGKNFGVFVWKVGDKAYEVARTRTEHGNGSMKDAEVFTVGVSIMDDLNRRDITMNAIAYRVNENYIIDPHNGIEHIQKRYIKPISSAFQNSIERPLRVARMACKFEKSYIDHWLYEMMVSMKSNTGWGMTHDQANALGLAAIPKDQIWAQWEKMCQEDYPGMFLGVMNKIEWLDFMPELAHLKNIPQDPEWHPEGKVLNHIICVMNATAVIAKRHGLGKTETVILVTAAACHDIGKASSTKINKNGRIVSPGHDRIGVPLAENFLKSMGAPNGIIKLVLELVKLHMFHVSRYQQKPAAAARWILSEMRYNSPIMLMLLIEADYSGRPPKLPGLPDSARNIFDECQKQNWEFIPIVTGKFLIKHFGNIVKPGKEMGRLIEVGRNAQIRGTIHNENSAISVMKSALKTIA